MKRWWLVYHISGAKLRIKGSKETSSASMHWQRSYVEVHNSPTDLLFFDVFDAQIKMWVESLQSGVCVFTKGACKVNMLMHVNSNMLSITGILERYVLKGFPKSHMLLRKPGFVYCLWVTTIHQVHIQSIF